VYVAVLHEICGFFCRTNLTYSLQLIFCECQASFAMTEGLIAWPPHADIKSCAFDVLHFSKSVRCVLPIVHLFGSSEPEKGGLQFILKPVLDCICKQCYPHCYIIVYQRGVRRQEVAASCFGPFLQRRILSDAAGLVLATNVLVHSNIYCVILASPKSEERFS
jgi:hypothetical protein